VLSEVSFKPWCAAKQTMAAAQALREMIEEGVPPWTMSNLVVAVPPPYLKMIDHGSWQASARRTSPASPTRWPWSPSIRTPPSTSGRRRSPFPRRSGTSWEDFGESGRGSSAALSKIVAGTGCRHDRERPAREARPSRSGRPRTDAGRIAGRGEILAPCRAAGRRSRFEELLRLSNGALDGGGAKALLAAMERSAAALG